MPQLARSPVDAADIGIAYVDVQHLMRLELLARDLTFLPRQKHRSILAGQHSSRVRGRGLNFEEIRHYLPGDDIRTIDWHVTLRTGEPHVRAYTEEKDRPAFLVVDQSMSMFFGSQRSLKSVVAAEFASIGAWMAFRGGDRVGAVVFNDTDIEHVKPHRSRNRLHQIFGVISRFNQSLTAGSAPVEPTATLNRALEEVLRLAFHDCLVCIASDFAHADDRTLRLLRNIAAHNDIVAALVFDPLAQKLPGSGRVVVSQGELQVELDLNARTVHEPLSDLFNARLKTVAELLRHSGVPMLAFTTAESVRDQLSRQLGHIAVPTAARA
ncbi:uncharacterized protein (DUF58 family) [Povalibacter uvarum]|uniref:Uncharacterized protein (DUF58 family) n=1 Tax=Povalibacter uvarum TaxID=732238 RepID=A0A841HSL3_9GAMM|nr:DUF58 domain-containing protein [Povalibacter uvarum]MBB6095200.1 uncharacterized protein (DUF58 family) [Povalibacter uvarum]